MALSVSDLQREYPFNPEGPFTSLGELTAAMSSKKYATDEAFRDAVTAKLAVTDRSSWGMAETRAPILSTWRSADAVQSEPEW